MGAETVGTERESFWYPYPGDGEGWQLVFSFHMIKALKNKAFKKD